MICKLNFGSGFQGCLDYITGKYDQDKHTKILAHSSGIPDMDNRTVAQIYDAYAEKGGHDIGKPVVISPIHSTQMKQHEYLMTS